MEIISCCLLVFVYFCVVWHTLSLLWQKIVASVAKIAWHLLHIQDARQCISTERQYRGLAGKAHCWSLATFHHCRKWPTENWYCYCWYCYCTVEIGQSFIIQNSKRNPDSPISFIPIKIWFCDFWQPEGSMEKENKQLFFSSSGGREQLFGIFSSLRIWNMKKKLWNCS